MPWPQTHACSHAHTHTRWDLSLLVHLQQCFFPYNAPCPVPSPIRMVLGSLCLVCTQPLRACFIFNKKHDLPSQREITWGDRWGRVEDGEGGPLPAPHHLLSHRRAKEGWGAVDKFVGMGYYTVTFRYDMEEEIFAWDYAAVVEIWDDGEPKTVKFGEGYGTYFYEESYKDRLERGLRESEILDYDDEWMEERKKERQRTRELLGL